MMKDKANMGGEEYLQGRRAGVEGTFGEKRKGGVEKTVVPAGVGDGGGEGSLVSTASRLYRSAVMNRGGGDGDQAMKDR